jgi:flagellar biosynthesis/type III secretory pathway protein FliH
MNIDYENLERDLESGTLRLNLEEELTAGFRQIQQSGERLPVASHYAAQIAEIINRNATLDATMQFELYQEVLEAVEAARVAVLGQEPAGS